MANPSILTAANAYSKVLAAQLVTSTTETTIATHTTGQSIDIKHGVITNTTASPVTVSMSVVPTGGTAGVANRVISGYSLAAGDSLDLRGYLVGAKLGEGDFVSVLAGTANAVTVVLTGVVTTTS